MLRFLTLQPTPEERHGEKLVFRSVSFLCLSYLRSFKRTKLTPKRWTPTDTNSQSNPGKNYDIINQ